MLAVHADLAKMLYVLCRMQTEVNSAAAGQKFIGEKKKLFFSLLMRFYRTSTEQNKEKEGLLLFLTAVNKKKPKNLCFTFFGVKKCESFDLFIHETIDTHLGKKNNNNKKHMIAQSELSMTRNQLFLAQTTAKCQVNESPLYHHQTQYVQSHTKFYMAADSSISSSNKFKKCTLLL